MDATQKELKVKLFLVLPSTKSLNDATQKELKVALSGVIASGIRANDATQKELKGKTYVSRVHSVQSGCNSERIESHVCLQLVSHHVYVFDATKKK